MGIRNLINLEKLLSFLLRCVGGGRNRIITFAILFSGCTDSERANEVVQVHANIVKLGFDSTLMVCNSLVDVTPKHVA